MRLFVFDVSCIDRATKNNICSVHFPWLGRDTKKETADASEEDDPSVGRTEIILAEFLECFHD